MNASVSANGNQAARGVVDRYWEDLLRLDPVIGTEVGDERFDDRLPDPSEAGRADRETVQRAALAAARAADRSDLDMVTRTTLDVMEAIALRDLAALEHRTDLLGCVSHIWGPSQMLAVVASLQRADTPERMDRYLARLAAFPAYFDAVVEVVREGAAAGKTSPALVVDRTIAQVERLIATPVEESPAMLPVPAAATGDRERVAAAVEDHLQPALLRFLAALRDYRPFATETIGLYAIPDGEAMYGAEIRSWTTMALDPKTVHDLGLESLGSIQQERRECASRLSFQDAAEAVAAHQASGRNTASSREEMVRIAQDQVGKGFEAAPAWFGRTPSANCEVRPVEEFREKDMPFAFYQSPSADGSRPGVYYVNTGDLADRPIHHLATTTYHEANPGHHFQVSIEQELEDRPALRRFGGILAGSAFIEGWGLYSERLADEMGLYADEYERMGMLEAQAMRATRLVVDTGIHAFGWTRQRSIDLLVEGGVPLVDAEIETDRYITMPGQALAYKIGQIEIEGWRADAAERDGAGFSLRAFHDHLLALGSLPLPALERELEATSTPMS